MLFHDPFRTGSTECGISSTGTLACAVFAIVIGDAQTFAQATKPHRQECPCNGGMILCAEWPEDKPCPF
jgi:hypothetical protein